MVFRGNSPTKLDAQGRVKIPAQHRKIFEEKYGPEVFVTSITGKNVLIYPMQQWEEIEAKMQEPPRMVPAKRLFLRNTAYFGQPATLDKQGRVVIHPRLRESAQIEDELSVMGALTHLEIWNDASIRTEVGDEPIGDEVMEHLAELGI